MRCISETGEQIGILPTSEALRLATNRGLDLVEISPNARPPVCRIMDFGKYRYEETRKEKLARKHQSNATLKEIKFHVNVEDHDYKTKLAHILEFLQKGHRVKTSVVFRGRENEHHQLGYPLLERLQRDCAANGVPESPAKLFGHSLVLFLRPQKTAKTPSPAPPPVAPAPRPPAPPSAKA